MKLTDFKALTFDCYGTLIDWESGMVEALKPLTGRLPVVGTHRFVDRVNLASPTEIREVWGMTPYRWNAPVEGAAALAELDELEVTVHFVATVFEVPAG